MTWLPRPSRGLVVGLWSIVELLRWPIRIWVNTVRCWTVFRGSGSRPGSPAELIGSLHHLVSAFGIAAANSFGNIEIELESGFGYDVEVTCLEPCNGLEV